MILECQRNSYLKEFSAQVISCEASDRDPNTYNVILNDTILFPEGGGQPDDRGTLNGVSVNSVNKQNGKVIHSTKEPVDVGEVKINVDWTRRFDHMQQHSGQHLLSALAESEFGVKTTSWWLGEETSFVELDTPTFDPKGVQALESRLNEEIRNSLPVYVTTYAQDDPKLEEVRTRLEIPDGVNEEIRVITIEGIDQNSCCGTHVSNLSHLQVIKLLYTEKGKKNKTNLHFLVGNRVLNYAGKCVERERKMNLSLKCGPNEHLDMVDKLNKSLKLSQKRAVTASKELTILEAKQFKALEPRPNFFSFHKLDAEPEILTVFANEINDKDVTLFLSVSDLKGNGQALIIGEQSLLDSMSTRICSILDGKGVAKNGRFQGKFKELSKRSEAEAIIKDALM